ITLLDLLSNPNIEMRIVPIINEVEILTTCVIIGEYAAIENILWKIYDVIFTPAVPLMAPPVAPATMRIGIVRLYLRIKPYKIGSVIPAIKPVKAVEPAKALNLLFCFERRKIPKAIPIRANTAQANNASIGSPSLVARLFRVIGESPNEDPKSLGMVVNHQG